MSRFGGRELSRRETALVVVLCLVAIAASVASLVLHVRGVRIPPDVAQISLRLEWSLICAAGIVVFAAMLRRERPLSVAVGVSLLFAGATIPWAQPAYFRLARGLGSLGMELPFLAVAIRQRRLRVRLAYSLVGIAMPAAICLEQDWVLWLFGAALLLALSASTVWPWVDKVMEEVARQEEEGKARYPVLRWVDRITLALSLALIILAVFIAILLGTFYWRTH